MENVSVNLGTPLGGGQQHTCPTPTRPAGQRGLQFTIQVAAGRSSMYAWSFSMRNPSLLRAGSQHHPSVWGSVCSFRLRLSELGSDRRLGWGPIGPTDRYNSAQTPWSGRTVSSYISIMLFSRTGAARGAQGRHFPAGKSHGGPCGVWMRGD